MARLTSDELAVWVARSCESDNLPVKITDPNLLERVAALLNAERLMDDE